MLCACLPVLLHPRPPVLCACLLPRPPVHACPCRVHVNERVQAARSSLLACLTWQVLQPPHGVVYVAAKSYYFGVGGGIKTFCSTVKADGIFEVTSVAKVEAEGGSGTVREIVEMRFPESIMPYFL